MDALPCSQPFPVSQPSLHPGLHFTPTLNYPTDILLNCSWERKYCHQLWRESPPCSNRWWPCCNFLYFITFHLAIAMQSTRHEAFSAIETVTKCLGARLQQCKTQLCYKLYTTQLHQIHTCVLKSPTPHTTAYNISSSAQLRTVITSLSLQAQ